MAIGDRALPKETPETGVAFRAGVKGLPFSVSRNTPSTKKLPTSTARPKGGKTLDAVVSFAAKIVAAVSDFVFPIGPTYKEQLYNSNSAEQSDGNSKYLSANPLSDNVYEYDDP